MLVERDLPLERLHDLAQQAALGQGSTVLLIGEAGIGKTSLLHEFLGRLRGFRVLQGGCEDLFTPRPLGPLRDMAAALGPEFGALLDGGADSGRLFPQVLERLAALPGPLVLVFEDLHWADQATLDLLKYLARRLAGLPLLLLASVRSDELPATHGFWRWVGDVPAASLHRITLQALSPPAVAALGKRGGREAEELFRITAGNPFFVTELLAALGDGGSRLPLSVRDAVWARMARLGEAERALLELVSASPGPSEDWLLEAILGSGAAAATDSCLMRGLLLSPSPGHVAFRHELARRAVLERISPSARRALHARLGAALANDGPPGTVIDLARLVHHAEQAQDAQQVLLLAPLAAQQAARLGAHRQAAAHYAAALRFVTAATSAEVAAPLYENWSYEAGLVRIDDEVIAARERAIALWRQLERADKVGFNLRWLSRMHWYRGEAALANRYGMEAIATLEQLPHSRELAMAYSLRSQHEMLQDHGALAISWGERALALATELGDVETRVHALNNIGTTRLFSGQPAGQALLEESLALALRHGFHEHAARVYTNLSEYAVVFKQFALAERMVTAGIAFDIEHDLDAWTHYLVGWQAQLRMEQGRLQEAEALARGVLALDGLALVMRLPAMTVLGRVRARQGEADGARCLDEALQGALATGEVQHVAPAYLGLMENAWLDEDLAACQAWLHSLERQDLSGVNAWGRGEIAAWRARLGQAGAPSASADGAPAVAAPWAAELAGDAQGAAQQWLDLGLPFEAGMALLQVRGDGAGVALVKAVALFEQVGARTAALRARNLARQLGQPPQLPKARRGPYGSTRDNPHGLTRREAQILELLMTGQSNAEIARQLVRSPRTVEHHVSALLDKLGASNRLELLSRRGPQN